MIELPDTVRIQSFRQVPIDYGFEQVPPFGGEARRIDRPGNRFQCSFKIARLTGEEARIAIARLIRARREGLRVRLPLLHPQGDPGPAVVDGADSEGTTLKLRSLLPGVLIKEGYWLSLIDSAGVRYLHNNNNPVSADVTGRAVLTVEPPLRVFPVDGNAVKIAAPEFEGRVTEVIGFEGEPGRLATLDGFTIEERK